LDFTMTKPDPDKYKGPGGLTLRQIHAQVKLSTSHDRLARVRTKSPQAISVGRWQRFVRYVWGQK
jgi:hypothetical protein